MNEYLKKFPELESLKEEFLSSKKKIVVLPHYKPDADALGSTLALVSILTELGHEVKLVSPSDYPDFLAWMKGNDEVLIYNEKTKSEVETLISEAEMLCCLDFSALSRLKSLEAVVRASTAKKLVIDHHLEPEDFADYLISDTTAAATAELLYGLLVAMGFDKYIDPEVANCLYAGIMTDTGSFKHSNTTKNVHDTVAKLITLGANTSKVSSLIYDTNSVDKLRFLGYALSEKLVVLEQYHTAYISINAEELKRFNTKTGDTEGLVNYALSIKNIVFAVLITERADGVRLSLRSKGDFSANLFAKENFNGGGHKNASGGSSDYGFNETITYFESLLPKYLSDLKKNVIA